jgi:hypothetical protein
VSIADTKEMSEVALAVSVDIRAIHESWTQYEAILIDFVGVRWDEADTGRKCVLGDDIPLNVQLLGQWDDSLLRL